jgi:hypothetical protein
MCRALFLSSYTQRAIAHYEAQKRTQNPADVRVFFIVRL